MHYTLAAPPGGKVEGQPVACRSEAMPPIRVSPFCLKQGLLASHASLLLLSSLCQLIPSELVPGKADRAGEVGSG